MEPWGRSDGDAWAPSFPLPFTPLNDGYFTAQAWRAGLLEDGGFRRVGFMPRMFPMGSIQREIEKERIREEIIREMEERRILEEEVRRELEEERIAAMRRAPMDRFEVRMGAKNPSEFMIREGYPPNQLKDTSGALPRSLPELKVDNKCPVPTLQKLETGSATASLSTEVLPAKEKLLGSKRKAEAKSQTSKLAKIANKDWTCDLCQITTTGEHCLKEHLKGKKHKSKETALKYASNTVNRTSGSDENPKPNSPNPAVVSHKEGRQNDAPKIVNIQVNGKMYQAIHKKNFFWCKTCKYKCKSTMAMASHLGGTKHNAKMKESEKNKKAAEVAISLAGDEVVEKALAEEINRELPEPDDEEVPIEKGDNAVITEQKHVEIPAEKASENEHTDVPIETNDKARD